MNRVGTYLGGQESTAHIATQQETTYEKDITEVATIGT